MTLLATNNRQVTCRVKLTKEGWWVSLTLSLESLNSGSRFLVNSDSIRYEMTGVDEASQTYGLSNWQGGIISGARYAFRALKAPIQQVCLQELHGQLSSGDVGAISNATSLAVARLLGRLPEFPLDFGGWEVEEDLRGLLSTETVTPDEKNSLAQSPPIQDRGDHRPLVLKNQE